MNRITTIFAAILMTASVFLPQQASAQAPQKMSYQAVVRNSSDALITSTAVGMQISILQGAANGTAVYVETHSPTTNTNGLVSLEIGAGIIVNGDFSTIDWANGPYFIRTETDPSAGNNYTITGTSELLSVPYALFSANGTPGPQGAQGPQGPAGSTGATGPTGATGAQGVAGTNGTNGINGTNGSDGNGIASTVDNGDGTFTFTYDDGSLFTTSNLTGAQGIQGAQGPTGLTGAAGTQGAQGIQGVAGTNGTNGLIPNGTAAGNTTFWNGTEWVVDNSNIFNNGTGVGVGTSSPDVSSKLDVNSTTQGFLMPRMTLAQRNLIASPATGLLIFQTDSTVGFYYYDGAAWVAFGGAGSGSGSDSNTLIYTTDGF